MRVPRLNYLFRRKRTAMPRTPLPKASRVVGSGVGVPDMKSCGCPFVQVCDWLKSGCQMVTLVNSFGVRVKPATVLRRLCAPGVSASLLLVSHQMAP